MTQHGDEFFKKNITPKTLVLIIGGAIIAAGLLIGTIFIIAKQGENTGVINQPTELDPFSITTSPTLMPAEEGGQVATPASDQTEITYTVRLGDTLTGIASLYEVDVKAIEEANDLSADMLQPDQTIIIPLTEEHQLVTHIVQFGQSLSSISTLYGIPPLLIEAANGITDPNAIIAGQRLLIIGRPSDPEIIIPEDALLSEIKARLGEIPPQPEWQRSLLRGDLAANYPITITADGFTLHAQPGTIGETNSGELSSLISDLMGEITGILEVEKPEPYDIYIASTLYDTHPHLRGFVSPEENALFILYDGTGTSEEQRYFLSAKLTQIIAAERWGSSASILYSEGLADAVARRVGDETPGYLHDQACADLYRAGVLPELKTLRENTLAFSSFVMSHESYLAAGCFAEYIIKTYGIETFKAIYLGQPIIDAAGANSEIEEQWLASLPQTSTGDLSSLADAYSRYEQVAIEIFTTYDGTEPSYLAYLVFDQARSALWANDVTSFNAWLADFTSLTGFIPSEESETNP